jgi:hypothetical protein
MSSDASSKPTTGNAAPSAEAAEYMELYRNMQQQASLHPSLASPLEALVAAHAVQNSGGALEEDADSDNDSDVDGTNSRFTFPNLTFTKAHAQALRVSSWSPLLRAHTMSTRSIPLPVDFVAYLREDGVWMPDSLAPVKASDFVDRDQLDAQEEKEEAEKWQTTTTTPKIEEIDTSDEEDDAIERAREARDQARASQPFFPEVVQAMEDAIKELGGSVFPSLDWTAPTDATWITTERSARCQTVGEILLLLKSSDKAQKELEKPWEWCQDEWKTEENGAASSSSSAVAASSTAATSTSSSSVGFTPALSLRKWSTLHRSNLFRAFVWRHQLLAVSQIDPNYYAHLQKDDLRDEVQDALDAILEDDIEPAMTKLGLEHYVLDVYLDTKQRLWLVRPKAFWPRATSAILFSWKELSDLAEEADQQEQRRKEQAEAIRAGREPPNASAWPSSASLSVPFRVIPSASAGLDLLRTMDTLKQRFPVEGFDVSDAAGIERWIERVRCGDLKQEK